MENNSLSQYVKTRAARERSKRGRVLAALLAALGAAAVIAPLWFSSLNYELTSCSEKLKSHLHDTDPGLYSEIQDVSIQRPWYSHSPEDWTYLVTVSGDPEPHVYRRPPGGFSGADGGVPRKTQAKTERARGQGPGALFVIRFRTRCRPRHRSGTGSRSVGRRRGP